MALSDPVIDGEMPLLMGLMESSSRRSTDMPLHAMNGNANREEEDESAQLKIRKNGGMMESIVNMANSILGAGKLTARPYEFLYLSHYRNHW